MTAHPYPQKIRQTVAETVARQILVMKEWGDLDSQTQHAFLTDADEILAALWEASRVGTLEQLEKLPRDVALIDRHGLFETASSESSHHLLERRRLRASTT
ncbi:MAG: hypothetical protein L0L17_07115, partial [Yaniella sp.]|nr:hypothetical protein [Yaniella sp.]